MQLMRYEGERGGKGMGDVNQLALYGHCVRLRCKLAHCDVCDKPPWAFLRMFGYVRLAGPLPSSLSLGISRFRVLPRYLYREPPRSSRLLASAGRSNRSSNRSCAGIGQKGSS